MLELIAGVEFEEQCTNVLRQGYTRSSLRVYYMLRVGFDYRKHILLVPPPDTLGNFSKGKKPLYIDFNVPMSMIRTNQRRPFLIRRAQFDWAIMITLAYATNVLPTPTLRGRCDNQSKATSTVHLISLFGSPEHWGLPAYMATIVWVVPFIMAWCLPLLLFVPLYLAMLAGCIITGMYRAETTQDVNQSLLLAPRIH